MRAVTGLPPAVAPGGVVILGATTPLGLALAARLVAGGSRAVGLIRDPRDRRPVEAAGAEAALFVPDRGAEALEAELAAVARGADALVLAAGTGTGPGSLGRASATRSPAALFAAAGLRAGVRRCVMVSSLRPPDGADRETGDAYLRAKLDAEEHLRGCGLEVTILRPGRLTDAPATGRVRLAPAGPDAPPGDTSRADAAATVCALLAEPRSAGLTLELRPVAAGHGSGIARAVTACVTRRDRSPGHDEEGAHGGHGR